MKRIIIFGYILFFIFSIIVVEKYFIFIIISLGLLYFIKKIFSKMSFDEIEEIFFIKFFRKNFPNNPLFK